MDSLLEIPKWVSVYSELSKSYLNRENDMFDFLINEAARGVVETGDMAEEWKKL